MLTLNLSFKRDHVSVIFLIAQITSLELIECCRDDIFLYSSLEISIALVPSTKGQWHFLIGFWIIAENKIFGKQKFRILAHVV